MREENRYLSVYPDGKHYQIPVLTKIHKKWCEDGECIIIDLKENRDMIQGQWTKKLKLDRL